MKVEKCPFHDIEPEYKIRIFRERTEKPYVSMSGENLIMVLPRLANYYYYCPECKKAVDSKIKDDADYAEYVSNYRKLASGYCSRHSKSAALSSWNTAVTKMVLRMFKKAVTGK